MTHRTTMRAEVASWIKDYRPNGLPPGLWDNCVGDFVTSALYRTSPASVHAARLQALVLSRLGAWCAAEGMEVGFETALDPDTVERFITRSRIPDHSRATYRSALRRLGPILTRDAPWEPRPKPLSRRHVARPYTPAELAMLRRDAKQQSTPARTRAARALIALGAGAGLDARWALDVTGTDVTVGSCAVRIRVGEPNVRTVVVLADFEADVAALATNGDALVGSRAVGRNRANKLTGSIELGSASPRLSLPRLRSTWLTTHLRLGTRLPELAAAAGLSGITVLSDLLAEIEPLGDAEATQMLRGLR